MMMITTCLYSLTIYYVWRLPIVLALTFFVIFLGVDGLYWGAVLSKIPKGGWVAALIALVFFIILMCWYMGQIKLGNYLKLHASSTSIERLQRRLHAKENQEDAKLQVDKQAAELSSSSSDKGKIEKLTGDRLQLDMADENPLNITRVPGMVVFVGKSGQTPPTFELFLERFRALPETVVFMNVRISRKARVPASEKQSTVDYGNNIYSMKVNVGFAEPPESNDLFELLRLSDIPQVEHRFITAVVSEEIVVVGSLRWYTWIWRWYLIIYQHLKQLFPHQQRGIYIAPKNTTVLGIVCNL